MRRPPLGVGDAARANEARSNAVDDIDLIWTEGDHPAPRSFAALSRLALAAPACVREDSERGTAFLPVACRANRCSRACRPTWRPQLEQVTGASRRRARVMAPPVSSIREYRGHRRCRGRAPGWRECRGRRSWWSPPLLREAASFAALGEA